jgi:hypothetical protein
MKGCITMSGPFLRIIDPSHNPSRIPALSICLGTLFAVLLLLSPVDALGDVYNVTFYNVTFSGPCVNSKAICTEVINGSGLYDPVADTTSNLSIQMTGSLNASLNAYGNPACNATGCLSPNVLYDPNALPGFNPIEFKPNLGNQFVAPTPQPLVGGASGTLLFVPGMCGGDQSACNTTGAFQGNGQIDYELTSGTYTSVDVGPSPVPEPTSFILLLTGSGMTGLLARRRRGRCSGQPS